MRKSGTALLLLVLAVSCIIVGPSFALIPKPPVPEFTVNLIDSSYDTQPTSTIDPYTGRTVNHPSQHVEARSIELRIKYIHFTSFEIENDSNTYTVNLYYNIRWKGHFENESAWREIYIPMNGYAVGEVEGDYYVVSYQGNYYSTEGLIMNSGFSATLPPGSQVDFQVEALIGYIHHVVALPMSAEVFEGEKSGWSSTQTLTITETAPTSTPGAPSSSTPQGTNPAPTQNGSQTQLPFGLGWGEIIIIVLLGVVAVLLTAAVVSLRKKNAKPTA